MFPPLDRTLVRSGSPVLKSSGLVGGTMSFDLSGSRQVVPVIRLHDPSTQQHTGRELHFPQSPLLEQLHRSTEQRLRHHLRGVQWFGRTAPPSIHDSQSNDLLSLAIIRFAHLID